VASNMNRPAENRSESEGTEPSGVHEFADAAFEQLMNEVESPIVA
jgi:hypothetical protein